VVQDWLAEPRLSKGCASLATTKACSPSAISSLRERVKFEFTRPLRSKRDGGIPGKKTGRHPIDGICVVCAAIIAIRFGYLE